MYKYIETIFTFLYPIFYVGLGSSSASYLSLLINSLILYALAYVIYIIFVLYCTILVVAQKNKN
jgi:miniconductance mechanosensitive channel